MKRFGRNGFAVAIVALAALLAPSTVLLESAPKSVSNYTNVSAVTLKAYEDAAGKPVDSILLIDQSAIMNRAVQALSSKLTPMGGSLYRASLTAAEARTLVGVDGVSLDVNRPANTGPLPEPAKPADTPNLLWDASVTVPGTDPNLVSTRTALGIDGSGVLVAVLDTGVDSDAIGLGNGKVVHREDFTTPPSNGSCSDNGKLDPYGHGTHVASIIAGAPDTRNPAIQGVAPGASIVDLRVFNCTASGSMADVDSALQWILDNRSTFPIKVVNMSLGASDMQTDGLDPTSILVNRLVAAGIVVAIAAGNNGDAIGSITAPGTAEFATTVASATVNKYGAYLSPFSSIGPTSDGRAGIDVTAPGGGIRAALTTAKSNAFNNETTMSGTSMATPYVAGIAALLIQQNPTALPSGTNCDISANCPAGVVKQSMTNGIQDRFKTSDWFEPGEDPISGTGLVSASATLIGTSVPSAGYTYKTLDPGSDNTLTFAPHETGFSFTIMLDQPYRTDAWDKIGMFAVSAVDSDYNGVSKSAVCTLLAITTCQFGAGGWTPRSFSYYVPASLTPQTYILRTARTVSFSVNASGYTGSMAYSNGIKATGGSITGSSATVTLERTLPSNTETVLTVSASGPLQAPAQVTLPAGPAGTQIQVSVAKTGDSTFASERVVFKTAGGSMVAASVAMYTGGNGRVSFPNALGYVTSDGFDSWYMAEDGSLLGTSAGQGMTNSSGYGNPWRLPAGSRTIEKYGITQTSASQIDVLGLSQDGTVGLFREFPAGSGIVPGDESVYFTYFTRNFATGETLEVGPDATLWPNWYSAATPAMSISNDGSQVSWAIVYPSGDKPIALVSQSGTGMATKVTLDTFSSTSSVSIFQVSRGKTLVRVRDGSNLDEFRVYTGANTYTVVSGNTFNAWYAGFSADGNAIGMMNPNTDDMVCVLNGAVTKFTPPRQLGRSISSDIRVANDCSWMIFTWEKKEGFPRGAFGVQLLKLQSDGTITRLDQSPGTSSNIGWRVNLAGTQFVRVSSLALEPGDINGQSDFYRGLGMNTPEIVKLRLSTHVFFDMDFSPLQYGVPRLLGSRTDSDGAITYRVTGGLCHVSGTYIVADSASGNCSFEVWAAETDSYLETGGSTSLPMAKRQIQTSEAYFQAPKSIGIGQATSFTFINTTNLQFAISTEGPCTVSDGKVTASAVGTCRLKATRAATSTDAAFYNYLDIVVSANPVPTILWTSSMNALTYGSTRTLTATTNGVSPVTFRVLSGNCHVSGNVLYADSGIGNCLVSAETAASPTWQQGSNIASIQLAKQPFNVSSVTFQVPETMRYGQLLSYTFTKTATRDDFRVSVSGPCELVGGKVSPTGVGICRLTLTAPETDTLLGYTANRDIVVSKGQFASDALLVSAPEIVAQGSSFTPTITNTTGFPAFMVVVGGCTLLDGLVTMDNTGRDCVIYGHVLETSNYAAITTNTTVLAELPTTNVATVLDDTDWNPTKVLPRGSTLSFNANVTVLSGQCVASGMTVLANGTSGTCSIRVGGYSTRQFVFSTLNLTIKLGPNVQTWTTALPTYATKKLTTQTFAFITNGAPKTNLGIAGTFTVSAGCKIVVSGKNVTIDMGKSKKCVVTLKAAAGFRVPGLSKTWTFTR